MIVRRYVATAGERVPAAGDPTKIWPFAPDLAVEVVSPSDRYTDVEAKTRDWLDAGASEVWIVDCARRDVKVVRRGGFDVFGRGDTLLSAVLPGFELVIDALFA